MPLVPARLKIKSVSTMRFQPLPSSCLPVATIDLYENGHLASAPRHIRRLSKRSNDNRSDAGSFRSSGDFFPINSIPQPYQPCLDKEKLGQTVKRTLDMVMKNRENEDVMSASQRFRKTSTKKNIKSKPPLEKIKKEMQGDFLTVPSAGYQQQDVLA